MTEAIAMLDYGERGRVRVHGDPEALAAAAATTFVRVVGDAVAARGRAVVALSGGSTPRRMGELLAMPAFRDRVPWDAIDVLWGDERWAPEESPESNAGVAKRTFLDHVPIPRHRVHPLPTVGIKPNEAAMAYEETLREVTGQREGVPRLDLVLLGMGDDGHTASLFPGTAAVHERDALAVAHVVPKLGATRLTLTPPVLNAGREVVFLVAGAAKAATLASVLEGRERPDELPSQVVRPVDGSLMWLVDREAAAGLTAAGAATDG